MYSASNTAPSIGRLAPNGSTSGRQTHRSGPRHFIHRVASGRQPVSKTGQQGSIPWPGAKLPASPAGHETSRDERQSRFAPESCQRLIHRSEPTKNVILVIGRGDTHGSGKALHVKALLHEHPSDPGVIMILNRTATPH